MASRGFARRSPRARRSGTKRRKATRDEQTNFDLLHFLRVGRTVPLFNIRDWFESIGRRPLSTNSTTYVDSRLRSLARPFAGHFGPRRACMSQTRVAVTALCVVTIATALGIEYIHREQTEEKLRLREGVIRDQELLRRKEALRGGRDAGEHAPDERRRG